MAYPGFSRWMGIHEGRQPATASLTLAPVQLLQMARVNEFCPPQYPRTSLTFYQSRSPFPHLHTKAASRVITRSRNVMRSPTAGGRNANQSPAAITDCHSRSFHCLQANILPWWTRRSREVSSNACRKLFFSMHFLGILLECFLWTTWWSSVCRLYKFSKF